MNSLESRSIITLSNFFNIRYLQNISDYGLTKDMPYLALVVEVKDVFSKCEA